MLIKEPGIAPESVRYFFTPSSFAEQILFYPTRIGHYFCSNSYHFSSNSEIGRQPSHQFHYMLFLVEAGVMHLKIEGKQYKAGPGELVLFNCQLPHEYEAKTDATEFYWLVFDGPEFHTMFAKIVELHEDSHVFEVQDRAAIRHAFSRLLRFGASETRIPETNVAELIYAMLCRLFAKKEGARSDRAALIDAAVRYIDQNYNKSISVEDIAREVNLSASYLTRCFRMQTGCSPHEYLTIRRIGAAKDLLLSTADTIREIAFAVGYRSEENFIRSFKSSVGVSPTYFRKYPI